MREHRDPEPIARPGELLAARLQQQLWVEQTLATRVLPQLLEAAHSVPLRSALARHLRETERHDLTLQRLLADRDVRPRPQESPALAGLVAEHGDLVAASAGGGPALLDLVHAQAAAATEHLELAAYDALAALAEALGDEELGLALREIGEQEQFALEELEKATIALLAEKVESQALP